MAYVKKTDVTVIPQGSQPHTFAADGPPSYYLEDQNFIISMQPNFEKFVSKDVIFRSEVIPVLVGIDESGGESTWWGLPCPPYYPRTRAEGQPGIRLFP